MPDGDCMNTSFIGPGTALALLHNCHYENSTLLVNVLVPCYPHISLGKNCSKVTLLPNHNSLARWKDFDIPLLWERAIVLTWKQLKTSCSQQIISKARKHEIQYWRYYYFLTWRLRAIYTTNTDAFLDIIGKIQRNYPRVHKDLRTIDNSQRLGELKVVRVMVMISPFSLLILVILILTSTFIP